MILFTRSFRSLETTGFPWLLLTAPISIPRPKSKLQRRWVWCSWLTWCVCSDSKTATRSLLNQSTNLWCCWTAQRRIESCINKKLVTRGATKNLLMIKAKFFQITEAKTTLQTWRRLMIRNQWIVEQTRTRMKNQMVSRSSCSTPTTTSCKRTNKRKKGRLTGTEQ